MTFLEMLIVIAIVAILLAMLLPALSTRCRGPISMVCLSNHRQILLGEMIWQADHGNDLRWRTFAANPTNLLVAPEKLAADYFRPLFQDYVKNSRAFVCPTDKSRHPATKSLLQNSNLSFFVNFSAGATNPPQSVLIGDRHVDADTKLLPSGLNAVKSGSAVSWTKELHGSLGSGSIGFVDGHAEFTKSSKVSQYFQLQNIATNLLAIP